jgi:hypothetical protein
MPILSLADYNGNVDSWITEVCRRIKERSISTDDLVKTLQVSQEIAEEKLNTIFLQKFFFSTESEFKADIENKLPPVLRKAYCLAIINNFRDGFTCMPVFPKDVVAALKAILILLNEENRSRSGIAQDSKATAMDDPFILKFCEALNTWLGNILVNKDQVAIDNIPREFLLTAQYFIQTNAVAKDSNAAEELEELKAKILQINAKRTKAADKQVEGNRILLKNLKFFNAIIPKELQAKLGPLFLTIAMELRESDLGFLSRDDFPERLELKFQHWGMAPELAKDLVQVFVQAGKKQIEASCAEGTSAAALAAMATTGRNVIVATGQAVTAAAAPATAPTTSVSVPTPPLPTGSTASPVVPTPSR